MQVRNINDGTFDERNPKHWYCGRFLLHHKPGQLRVGNPYMIGRDGTREEVIELYRKLLWGYVKHDPQMRAWLRSLPEGAVLYCHCAPEPCHCEVIVRAAKWLQGQKV